MDSLLVFQSGDVRQACNRFKNGEAETYLDQRRSVDFLVNMARTRPVTVVSMSDDPHDEIVEPGLRSIGVPAAAYFAPGFATSILPKVQPATAIAAIPHPDLLHALASAKIPVLVCLADVMRAVRPQDMLSLEGLRRFRLNHQLRRHLRHHAFTALANHSLSASRSLRNVLGLPAERIIPWEWSRLVPDPLAKSAPSGNPFRLFCAGMLIRDKGIGDLLDAAAIVLGQGVDLHVDIAGQGDDQASFQERAAQPDLKGKVTFLGLIPNDEVRGKMREADAVVVPSRHAYAEGLPNAIFEAFASRTPLIVSDHPAYKDRVKHNCDVLMFTAGQPASLAAELLRLKQTLGLYTALSERAAAALDRLYVGTSWYELMTSFVTDPHNETGWVARNSLAELERRIAATQASS